MNDVAAIFLCPPCGAAFLNAVDDARRRAAGKPARPPLWTTRMVMAFVPGAYKEGIVRDVALHLAARLTGLPHQTALSDESLHRLVPMYAEEILRGLDCRLPKDFRKDMADFHVPRAALW